MLFILVKRFPYALVYEHVGCLVSDARVWPTVTLTLSDRVRRTSGYRRAVFRGIPYLMLLTKRLVNDNSSDEGKAALVVDSATDMTTTAVVKANEQPAILYTVRFGQKGRRR